jgi:hypothetical protein
MNALQEAMAEIEAARSDVTHSDVRTQLESITTSLQEMLDTAAGEQTEGDVAFANTEVAGTAPTDDDLLELERSLNKLVENTERESVQTHLENAHEKIANYRTEHHDE